MTLPPPRTVCRRRMSIIRDRTEAHGFMARAMPPRGRSATPVCIQGAHAADQRSAPAFLLTYVYNRRVRVSPKLDAVYFGPMYRKQREIVHSPGHNAPLC